MAHGSPAFALDLSGWHFITSSATSLGGTWNLPHAEANTIILPHATAYNAPTASEAMKRIAAALLALSATRGLFDLAHEIGAPTSLKSLGMSERDLDRAARLATENPYFNPRPLEYAAIRKLLDNAYFGRRPEA